MGTTDSDRHGHGPGSAVTRIVTAGALALVPLLLAHACSSPSKDVSARPAKVGAPAPGSGNAASTGADKWKYEPNPVAASQGVACCDVVNRGAAYDAGKIYYNTLDGQTVAVDAASGKESWRAKVVEINRGETITMAPLVVRGKVLVGNSGGEFGVRGWLTALDGQTRRQVWRAYSDPQLNLIYYGTANPGPWNAEPPCDEEPVEGRARHPSRGPPSWAPTFGCTRAPVATAACRVRAGVRR